jgi:hypothetical protein
MKKLAIQAVGLLAFSAIVQAVSAESPMPLKVVSRTAIAETVPSLQQGVMSERTYKVLLRNDSTRVITAWSFTCLYSTGDGPFGTTNISADSLRWLQSEDGLWTKDVSNLGIGDLLPPGGMIELTVPENTEMIARRYGAMACQVDATIFDDGASLGSTKALGRLFESRQQQAADASNLTALDPIGCSVSVIGVPIAGNPCDPKNRTYQGTVSFGVGATCKDNCTGDTYQLTGMTATASGLSCGCPATFIFKGRVTDLYQGGKRVTTEAWSKGLVSGQCAFGAVARSTVDCLCPSCGNPPDTPILVSIGDSNYQLTSATDGVRFDLDGDGVAEQIAWTAAEGNEGFLVLDRNENGHIDDYKEVFGNKTAQLPSEEPNGWLALAVWDDPFNGGNADATIDAADAIFSDLQIWVDQNHNGFSEPEELSGLAEAGFDSISLDFKKSRRQDPFGNEFTFWATFGKEGGGNTVAWDVSFVRE